MVYVYMYCICINMFTWYCIYLPSSQYDGDLFGSRAFRPGVVVFRWSWPLPEAAWEQIFSLEISNNEEVWHSWMMLNVSKTGGTPIFIIHLSLGFSTKTLQRACYGVYPHDQWKPALKALAVVGGDLNRNGMTMSVAGVARVRILLNLFGRTFL